MSVKQTRRNLLRMRHEEVELNLIPLIDIMSVMVAFLLVYSADVEVIQKKSPAAKKAAPVAKKAAPPASPARMPPLSIISASGSCVSNLCSRRLRISAYSQRGSKASAKNTGVAMIRLPVAIQTPSAPSAITAMLAANSVCGAMKRKNSCAWNLVRSVKTAR